MRSRAEQLVATESASGLRATRSFFFSTDWYSIEHVIDDYNNWVERPAYALVRYEDKNGDEAYRAFRVPKRGDELYCKRVLARFNEVKEMAGQWKDYAVQLKRRKYVTKCVFLTLTYAQRGTTSWEQIGKHWNRFISAMRKRYGRISTIRVWESQDDTTAHIHALLFCHDYEFSVFPTRPEWAKRIVWRLDEKRSIETLWGEGFSDLQGVDSVPKVLNCLLYTSPSPRD